MKKTIKTLTIIIIVVLIMSFLLAGCSNQPKTLSKPKNVRVESTVLKWSAVQGAMDYSIYIDGEEVRVTTSTSFDLAKLSLSNGLTYEIQVKANGDGYTVLSGRCSDSIFWTIPLNLSPDNNIIYDEIADNAEKLTLSSNEIEKYLTSPSKSYYGVGRTVNVITDEYIEVDSMYPKIFDDASLLSLNWNTSFLGKMKATTVKQTSMKDFYAKISTEYNQAMSNKLDVDCFSAGLERSFGFSADVNYKNVANEIYYRSYQNYVSNRVEIDERSDLTKFSNIIKQSVLDDARNLTPEQFIYKYGTHVLLAAYYGGQIEMNYYICNNGLQWETSVALNISNKVEAGLKGLASGNVEQGFSIKTSAGCNTETTYDSFSANAIGGAAFEALNESDFLKNYGKWVDSMNGRSIEDSCIVGLPPRSLAAIWDLFPTEYANERVRLSTYFNQLASKTSNDFLSNYERSYTAPVEPVDEGDTINYAGGHGTEESPYLIKNIVHLTNIKLNMDKIFSLCNDIDITNIEWNPIGYNNGAYEEFRGKFDGNFHKIIGLTRTTSPNYVGKANDAYVGLFGILSNATIENIILENVNMVFDNMNYNPSYVYVGAIAGESKDNTLISCCSVSGFMRPGGDYNTAQEEMFGGILGAANNTKIVFCKNTAELRAYHWKVHAGGILGVAEGSGVRIISCYNNAYIEVGCGYKIGNYTGSAGGILGRANDNIVVNIENCYAIGNIKIFNGAKKDIGGICGTATDSRNQSSIINNCYCVMGSYSTSNNFDSKINAVYNCSIVGWRVTESDLKSGNQCGPLKSYSEGGLAVSEANCWLFEIGELPKLFWEKS